LLSVVDGVMDGGKVIDVIEKVDEQSLSVVSKTRSRLGSGGMGSKMT
ncbi:MAG TPA: glutamate 5-kinase, partial [Phycisphaerales bacterium]|nr:glutamate 5-kinase [Phycisphaerales bacterium]